MSDTTTIEIKKTTHAKLNSIRCMGLSFDDVVNILLQDYEEVGKYIDEYVKSKNGECVYEMILGRHVIANHYFINGVCEKCGLSTPDTAIAIHRYDVKHAYKMTLEEKEEFINKIGEMAPNDEIKRMARKSTIL